jgi:hypothetical protein
MKSRPNKLQQMQPADMDILMAQVDINTNQ